MMQHHGAPGAQLSARSSLGAAEASARNTLSTLIGHKLLLNYTS